MRLMHIEVRIKKPIVPVIEKFISKLKAKKIGIVMTIQHLYQLNEVKIYLESQGKQVFVGNPRGRASCLGQVLGCDASAAKAVEQDVDCFLYIGTGEFHPMAVALTTEKEVYVLNPVSETLSKVSEKDRQEYMRKRVMRIAKFNQAWKVGIIVSTKPGQNALDKAVRFKKKIEVDGKKAYIFMCDTLNPGEILNFKDIEVWVNTACPRIVDDQELYEKPIINLEEIEEAKDL